MCAPRDGVQRLQGGKRDTFAPASNELNRELSDEDDLGEERDVAVLVEIEIMVETLKISKQLIPVVQSSSPVCCSYSPMFLTCFHWQWNNKFLKWLPTEHCLFNR